MAILKWDEDTKRLYETGVQKGVLFVKGSNGTYGNGVAWNGLTKVTEKPSGAETTSLYANDTKYLDLMSVEELSIGIEAYMSPEEFDECDGTTELYDGVNIGQQTRKSFALCYRTALGNDANGTDYGYKLHIVYGLLASPSEKAYSSINNSPEAMTLTWDAKSTPVAVGEGYKPTSLITINSKTADSDKLEELEELLYGTADAQPTLPLPAKIIEIFGAE